MTGRWRAREDEAAGAGVGTALVVTTLVVAVAVPNSGAAVLPWRAAQLVLVALMAGHVLLGGARAEPPAPVVALALLAAWPALTLGAATWTAAAGALLDAALVLLVGGLVATAARRDARPVLRAVVALGCAEAVLAVVQLLTGGPTLWGYLGSGTRPVVGVNPVLVGADGRAVGTLAQPIPVGVLCAVALVLVLSGPLAGRRGDRRDDGRGGRRGDRPAGRVVVAGVLAAGIAASGTRTALVALAAAVVVRLVHRLVPPRLIGTRAALVVLALAGGAAAGSWQSAAGDVADTFSVTHRLNALRSIPALLARPVRDALLGSGDPRTGELFTSGLLVDDGSHAVDNQLVATLAACGVLGALLLLVALGAAVLRAGRLAPAVAVLPVVLWSFDALLWSPVVVLAVVLVAAAASDGERGDEGPGGAPAVSDAAGGRARAAGAGGRGRRGP